MFTPNKDSIIYKHRKINDPNNTTNTNNDNPEQSYNKEIKFLKGVHLRDDIRKFVNIPINEEMAINLLKDFLESKNNE